MAKALTLYKNLFSLTNEAPLKICMDGYLNCLSLEYESVWDTKSSWCQPWTITLTVTWLALNSIAVTSAVAALIGLWWYTFLYSHPKSYSGMIAARKKKIKGGLEDTYGAKKG